MFHMQYSGIFRLEEKPLAHIWLSAWIFKVKKARRSYSNKSCSQYFWHRRTEKQPPSLCCHSLVLSLESTLRCSLPPFITIRGRSPPAGEADTRVHLWHSCGCSIAPRFWRKDRGIVAVRGSAGWHQKELLKGKRQGGGECHLIITWP